MPEEKKKEEKKEDKKAEMMDFRNLKTGEYVLHVNYKISSLKLD